MNALAGLMNPAAVGQMVQSGFQQGQAQRADMETRNALSSLAGDPNNAEAMQRLARFNPQAAMQMQDRQRQMQAQQVEAQKAQLAGAAAQGDKRALASLWGLDWETAQKLSDAQAEKAAEGFEIMAQYALAIDQLPPEQRPIAWDQAVDQMVRYGFDQFGQYRGQYSEQALQGVVGRAKEMKTLLQGREMESFNVGPGEWRYERDPRTGEIRTVVQPNYGGKPAFSPVNEKVIGGTTYVQDENGDWYVKGGSGGNAAGGFPESL